MEPMDPRLVANAGPLRGTVLTLVGEEFSIGRDPATWLSIDNRSVSRQHCVIKKDSGQFMISDLDSLNGTFVNGMPIKERLLEHGDEIRVGDSLFLFYSHEVEAAPSTASVQLDGGRLIAHSTLRLRWEDGLYLQPDKVLGELPVTARLSRDLNALLKISTRLNSIRTQEELQHQLLELIFEVVPCDCGALLLLSTGLNEFASTYARKREGGATRSVQVSSTVVHQVLREKVAILSNNLLENTSFSSSESLIGSQVKSLLAVPLLLRERMMGVIYLAAYDIAARFDQNHLELMTGIAGIAAMALENVRHLEQLEEQNRRLKKEINIEHNMIGESSRMREVYQFITKAAPTDSTVLIRGESGTGKELVARAIHSNSPRTGKAFVAFNCATLSESLLESELFGHEKGAFTGAVAQKKGKLETADGGTVFLDEVGELAPVLQAKLLRVLQERQFERVGGTRPIRVDIRLIAATNKDLEKSIQSGTFREDLFYRLNVVSLTMPPLRDRREDIPLLARYFVEKFAKKSNRPVSGISTEARECLVHYDWPGNVRELENAIERAMVLGSTELMLPEDLPETVLEGESLASVPITKYYEAIHDAKKQFILKALEQTKGNYTEAAKLLGVHPNNLHRLMRQVNLKGAAKG